MINIKQMYHISIGIRWYVLDEHPSIWANTVLCCDSSVATKIVDMIIVMN